MNDTFECVGFMSKITLRVRHLNQKKFWLNPHVFVDPKPWFHDFMDPTQLGENRSIYFKCGITNQFPTTPVLIFWHFFENLVQFRIATGKTILYF